MSGSSGNPFSCSGAADAAGPCRFWAGSNPGLLLALVLLALGGLARPGRGEELLGPLVKGGEVITARWHLGPLPTDPGDVAWSQVEPAEVRLYPQATVRPRSATREPVALRMKALYNGAGLALCLEWADGQPAATHAIGRFPDAAAVQWPVRYGPGIRLPYVGMGDPGSPVALWFWRADGRMETLAAEGFGSLTSQPPDGVEAGAAWDQGRWRVVLKRPLTAPPGTCVQLRPATDGLVPFALAVWNGEATQRDGDKFLSGWHFLLFEQGKLDPRYAKGLVWSPRLRGDPKVGEALMIKRGCMVCHSYPANPIPTEVGPDLTYAGGIHRPDYLLESIRRPSALIVPDKTFSAVLKGRRVSTMPAVVIPQRELLHLVEYLRTLR